MHLIQLGSGHVKLWSCVARLSLSKIPEVYGPRETIDLQLNRKINEA